MTSVLQESPNPKELQEFPPAYDLVIEANLLKSIRRLDQCFSQSYMSSSTYQPVVDQSKLRRRNTLR